MPRTVRTVVVLLAALLASAGEARPASGQDRAGGPTSTEESRIRFEAEQAGLLRAEAERDRTYAQGRRDRAKQYRELAEQARKNAQTARDQKDQRNWEARAREHEHSAAELEREASRALDRAKEKEAQAARLEAAYAKKHGPKPAAAPTPLSGIGDARLPRLRLEQVLGVWRHSDTDEPFVIVQQDPGFEAYWHRLEAHTPRRVWKGNYYSSPRDGSMIQLKYTPQADEMNPEVPQWARRKIEGKLEWKIEIDPAGTCGTPSLIAAFYPGEITWKEDGENDPNGAWISGKGKAREITMTYSELDAVYYTYGSPSLNLRLPGIDFDRNLHTVDGLTKGQLFHVDVILPPELAEKQGDTLKVEIKNLKNGDKTSIDLQRGAMRMGRSVIYTHYNAVTIGDSTDVTLDDRDPPFLSLNYILGYQGARLSLAAGTGDMIEFRYADALQRVPIHNSWVQRKIARHKEAVDRLRPLFSMVLADPKSTNEQKNNATKRLSMLRNYERIMESDKIHDYIRYKVGDFYLASADGQVGMTEEQIAADSQVPHGWALGRPLSPTIPDSERDGSKDPTGIYKGVVWTSLYEKSLVEATVTNAKEEYRNVALNEIPKAIAFALYSAVAGLSGAGDAVTLFGGFDIFGKAVPAWQRVTSAIGLASSSILTFTAPHVMTPPSYNAYSPGQVSARAMQAGARARLKEMRLQVASRTARNIEAAMAKMKPEQRASVMPAKTKADAAAISDKAIGCKLASRPKSTGGPPPHPGPIDADFSRVKSWYGVNAEVVNPGQDLLLPPQEFMTCQCGAPLLSVKENIGTAPSEMVVFGILVRKGVIKPGANMPLANGYSDAQLVTFLESVGAEVMVIPAAGKRLTLEAMSNWMSRGWRMRDVVKTMDDGTLHAIELRELPRNAKGEIEEVVWYDPAFGKMIKTKACDYLNDLAMSGLDTILYRWQEGPPGSAAGTGPRPTIEYPAGKPRPTIEYPTPRPTIEYPPPPAPKPFIERPGGPTIEYPR